MKKKPNCKLFQISNRFSIGIQFVVYKIMHRHVCAIQDILVIQRMCAIYLNQVRNCKL